MEQPKKMLEGIRVLEFGSAALAPVCGRILADMGADVIKIEPLEGDFARITTEPMVDSVTFIVGNLDKRSVVLNLRDQRAREIVYKLIPTVDAVIQNFRPGVMKELGIDYETLSAINPRLVYGSFYCYGEAGPIAHRRGGDMWAQAFTGMVATQGPPGPPQQIAHTINDYGGGAVGALGIMAALFVRERTGVGQEVVNNLINVAVLFQWPAISHYLMEGTLFKRQSRAGARSRFPAGAYTAKDGDVLTIFGTDQDEWQVVCSILGIEHLLNDPRYRTPEDREARKLELYPMLDQAFSKKDRAEWARLFQEQKLRCDPCLDYAEFTAHPQFEANQLSVKVKDPRDGELTLPSIPLRFKKYPPREYCEHAPILGEHTKEVLQELGYTVKEIDKLHEEAVIGLPTPDMFTVRRTIKGPARPTSGRIKEPFHGGKQMGGQKK